MLKCTNARSHNPLGARQLAPKPVDVFGPSAPRVRRRSCRPPSRRVEGTVICAHRRTLPPAVSPLGRAPYSVALPSLAGSSLLRGVRGSVGSQVRNGVVERRVVPMSTRRAADATPHTLAQHRVEECRITTMQKGTTLKGRPPFCHVQCSAHRGPSACCALTTHYLVNIVCPYDLTKIRTRFTT